MSKKSAEDKLSPQAITKENFDKLDHSFKYQSSKENAQPGYYLSVEPQDSKVYQIIEFILPLGKSEVEILEFQNQNDYEQYLTQTKDLDRQSIYEQKVQAELEENLSELAEGIEDKKTKTESLKGALEQLKLDKEKLKDDFKKSQKSYMVRTIHKAQNAAIEKEISAKESELHKSKKELNEIIKKQLPLKKQQADNIKKQIIESFKKETIQKKENLDGNKLPFINLNIEGTENIQKRIGIKNGIRELKKLRQENKPSLIQEAKEVGKELKKKIKEYVAKKKKKFTGKKSSQIKSNLVE